MEEKARGRGREGRGLLMTRPFLEQNYSGVRHRKQLFSEKKKKKKKYK